MDGTSQEDFEQPPHKKLKPAEASADIGQDEKRAESESDESEDTFERVKEIDVGITEYISKHQGFHGILKQRYSDFLVNEIDEDGQILHLSDIAECEEEIEPEEAADLSVLPDECIKELRRIAEARDEEENVVIEVGEDKDVRTAVHKAIRALKLPLESSTEFDDKGNKVIRVSKLKLAFGQRYVPAHRWPATRPNYCHFLLYKENRDTVHALSMIAKALRVRPSLFSYAGTKDKRAKTVQKVSAFRIPSHKLLKLNKWWRREILLGNCTYQKEVLRLGDQGGNHFSIVLRDVTGSDELVNEAVESLKNDGFINYFGMQRFGTAITPTHKVGKALLKSNWAEAIDLILMANPGVHIQSSPWREVWAETKDPSKTLEAMDRRHCIERTLLEGMRRYGPNDFVNSLDTIPRNTRTMYVHAYQSYIWNVAASRRLSRYGMKPVPGDLVRVSQATRHSKQNGERDTTLVLTEENMSQYDMYDIVLPLPGYDVAYPENTIKDVYTELLAEDGLKTEDLKHRVKDYSLPGAYRPILVKPHDVSWEILRYDDVTIPLLLSDADRLSQMEEPKSVEGGKYKAVKLHLSLPPSTYATMAVREVVKRDTSSVHQASLNT